MLKLDVRKTNLLQIPKNTYITAIMTKADQIINDQTKYLVRVEWKNVSTKEIFFKGLRKNDILEFCTEYGLDLETQLKKGGGPRVMGV
jgi:hypothetical protein